PAAGAFSSGRAGIPRNRRGPTPPNNASRVTSRKKTRTTSIPPTFREARTATEPQHRLAPTRRGAAHGRPAKRRAPRKPSHAIHAHLSIGIGASWRDHEQYGRCTKELL